MSTESELSPEGEESEFLHMMAVGEEFLEHHGIKGMKWGQRKANRAATSTARIQRVAQGHGSTRDKAHTLRTSSDLALIRSRGSLTKEAQTRSTNIQARNTRLANGTASRTDKATKNDTTASGTGHGRPDPHTVFTPDHLKITANPTDHAVTKQVKKDHNQLSDAAFRQKYAVSKGTYRKRVAKHGDPYKHVLATHPKITAGSK